MKKQIFCALTAALLIFSFAACNSESVKENDSGESQISSQASEVTKWDITKLEKPTAVDSFDAAVIVYASDTDPANCTLYYNGESYDSGSYNYLGNFSGRYYFMGIENYSDDYGFISSCDEDYRDFKKHKDITEKIGYDALLYDGKLYNWQDNTLCAYDLQTNSLSTLTENLADYATIDAITDGWVYSNYNNTTHAYCIKTGEVIEKEHKSTEVASDGLLFGFKYDAPNPVKIVSCDFFSDTVTDIKEAQAGDSLLCDDNGDVWAVGENNVVYKMHDAKSADSANHVNNKWIANGWYYYRYRANDNKEYSLARFDLSTGKTEYCPDIIVSENSEPKPYTVLNHYMGFNREKDK
ncbi:MAG: hypothetical protein E7539_07095 [Ruminococcaceae bacterium]|nr:hypothetical protein [Oscillospiraceae bacterium]